MKKILLIAIVTFGVSLSTSVFSAGFVSYDAVAKKFTLNNAFFGIDAPSFNLISDKIFFNYPNKVEVSSNGGLIMSMGSAKNFKLNNHDGELLKITNTGVKFEGTLSIEGGSIDHIRSIVDNSGNGFLLTLDGENDLILSPTTLNNGIPSPSPKSLEVDYFTTPGGSSKLLFELLNVTGNLSLSKGVLLGSLGAVGGNEQWQKTIEITNPSHAMLAFINSTDQLGFGMHSNRGFYFNSNGSAYPMTISGVNGDVTVSSSVVAKRFCLSSVCVSAWDEVVEGLPSLPSGYIGMFETSTCPPGWSDAPFEDGAFIRGGGSYSSTPSGFTHFRLLVHTDRVDDDEGDSGDETVLSQVGLTLGSNTSSIGIWQAADNATSYAPEAEYLPPYKNLKFCQFNG